MVAPSPMEVEKGEARTACKHAGIRALQSSLELPAANAEKARRWLLPHRSPESVESNRLMGGRIALLGASAYLPEVGDSSSFHK